MFLDGSFLIFASDSIRESNQIRLPFGEGKTSPVAAEDVARVIAALAGQRPLSLRSMRRKNAATFTASAKEA